MIRAGSKRVQLDRAHLEGRVIASNLEHLGMILREEDRGLREELRVFTKSFERYVDKLSDASGVAANVERSTDAGARDASAS